MLNATNLKKSFDGLGVLRDISLQVNEGEVVAIIGMTVFFNAREPLLHIEQDNCTSFTIKDYLKAVAVGYSNPGAVLVMFGLFAFFGIDTQLSGFHLAPVVIALSLGSASYWFCFSWECPWPMQ